ncbi:hypothetical protein VNO77_35169 [Canavalia gladiata]|uniref:Uncharacterized protein n=1 Tax=Canavalia gladiata TaxID=3824 RepID=A0AAN9KHH3_CANGL
MKLPGRVTVTEKTYGIAFLDQELTWKGLKSCHTYKPFRELMGYTGNSICEDLLGIIAFRKGQNSHSALWGHIGNYGVSKGPMSMTSVDYYLLEFPLYELILSLKDEGPITTTRKQCIEGRMHARTLIRIRPYPLALDTSCGLSRYGARMLSGREGTYACIPDHKEFAFSGDIQVYQRICKGRILMRIFLPRGFELVALPI